MTGRAEAIEKFQALTRQARDGFGENVIDGFTPMDPENRPNPFKAYEGLERVQLPHEFEESTVRAVDVLAGEVDVPPAPLDLQRLAHLLFFCGGVTRTIERATGTSYFRTAPSAGNLHPLETYVVAGAVEGLAPGVYHVDHLTFSLETLRPGDWRAALADAVADEAIATGAASVVTTGITWRTAWKYAERGLRHVYWDAGTSLANLLAVSDATGVATRVDTAFDDDAVARLLGIDGIDEFPVVVVNLGGPVTDPALPPADGSGAVPAALPLSPRPIRFPGAAEAHRAGVLTGASAVAAWRLEAGRRAPDPTPAPERQPAPPPNDGATIEEVILRRGSTRLFRRQAVPRDHFDWPLAVATRPIEGDAWSPGGVLRFLVSVHAVEGIEPARYRFEGGELVAEAKGDEEEVRSRSQALCCDQPLGGDSAYTVYECADLEGALGALGARGYRVAQLEAGVVAGRLHLAAYAAGFGATSLTFFDDEVREAFGTPADCMLVTALGMPDYRSTAGGRPGRTTELKHWSRLMERFTERYNAGREGEG